MTLKKHLNKLNKIQYNYNTSISKIIFDKSKI